MLHLSLFAASRSQSLNGRALASVRIFFGDFRPAQRARLCPFLHGGRGMKRASTTKQKPRPKVPDYCDVVPKQDEDGEIIWPAPKRAMENARAFIKEWYVPLSTLHPPLPDPS